ncbi:MAG: hypothetical protein IPI05_06550 [Flavobacteriales bacterium]|nr:hypothetical protein [Flavobacteriales bacterium]
MSAGPDQSVCVLSDHANLQGSIQNGSPSGIWTATGTGTFQPSADVLNAQYFFSAADVANGSVVLTFTATNTGTCPSGRDQMTLTFGSTSYAFAGADQNLANSPIAQLAGNFSGGAQGILWSTSGSRVFSNNTDPNATYPLSNADIAAGAVQLTITTITNGSCAASSDASDTERPRPSEHHCGERYHRLHGRTGTLGRQRRQRTRRHLDHRARAPSSMPMPWPRSTTPAQPIAPSER